MSFLTIHLTRLRDQGNKLLLPFFTGGYPNSETFVKLLLEAEQAGADAIEVGIPFSDPSADGPVIQATSMKALARGASVESIMADVKSAREAGLTVPLLYMTYYNPVLHKGAEAFSKAAADSGADGVLVVDLPPEEAAEFAPFAQEAGLDTIFLIAPTTPDERFPRVLTHCGGFLYCVSVTGVTGAKRPVVEEVAEVVARVRPLTQLPVIVGFGVTGPESAKAIAGVADGVIVGSAVMSAIGDKEGDAAVEAAGAFITGLRGALDG
jgi:tryptophan synthase alpha chain